MRRNQVISKRKLISNIVGWPDYYISKKGGRRKAQYYEKRHVEYYCNICGKKRYENNKPV